MRVKNLFGVGLGLLVVLGAQLGSVSSASAHAGGWDGSHVFHVPPDRVPPPGLCRIWYRQLPPDRQPPPMSCERAHAIAAGHGGRVIQAISPRSFETGEVAATPYGPSNLRGVPPDRLPPPGWCRVWFDGNPPDRQPPPMHCASAERYARFSGGRVLYTPGSDVY
jgi:hypothetical protein